MDKSRRIPWALIISALALGICLGKGMRPGDRDTANADVLKNEGHNLSKLDRATLIVKRAIQLEAAINDDKELAGADVCVFLTLDELRQSEVVVHYVVAEKSPPEQFAKKRAAVQKIAKEIGLDVRVDELPPPEPPKGP